MHITSSMSDPIHDFLWLLYKEQKIVKTPLFLTIHSCVRANSRIFRINPQILPSFCPIWFLFIGFDTDQKEYEMSECFSPLTLSSSISCSYFPCRILLWDNFDGNPFGQRICTHSSPARLNRASICVHREMSMKLKN